MEEEESGAVYEDYRFVTKQEVEELNATSLIGTPLLKGYMHGFFMDSQLYQRLKAVSEPFAFEEWRKKRLKEKLEQKRASRISIQKRLPKVNQALASRLLKANKKGDEDDGDGTTTTTTTTNTTTTTTVDPSNPLGDARFAKMFTSKDYEVDEEAEDFKLRNPSGVKRRREEDESDDELVVQDAFQEVEGGDEESSSSSDGGLDSSSSDDEEHEEEEEEPVVPVMKKQQHQQQAPPGRKPKFMELNDASSAKQALSLNDPKTREEAMERKQARKMPLKERLLAMGKERSGGENSGAGRLVVDKKGGGSFREYVYYPKGSSRSEGGSGGEGRRPSGDLGKNPRGGGRGRGRGRGRGNKRGR